MCLSHRINNVLFVFLKDFLLNTGSTTSFQKQHIKGLFVHFLLKYLSLELFLLLGYILILRHLRQKDPSKVYRTTV